MTHKLYTIFFLSLVLIYCSKTKPLDTSFDKYSDTYKNKKINNIQNAIQKSFDNGYNSKTFKSLDSIYNHLDSIDNQNHYDLYTYWKSYTKYYSSILSIIIENKPENAKQYMDEALKILENIHELNNEELLLKIRIMSHSIAYNKSRAAIIFSEINDNLKNSIRSDSLNIRCNFIRANLLYYHPNKMNKTNIIKWCQLAIKQPKEHSENHLPNWGEEESYALLLNYYNSIDQKKKASIIMKEGLETYPNSNIIKWQNLN